MDCISTTILRKIKSDVRLLVGQHASPALPAREDYSCYDLVVSSFPPTVELFRHKGITSELNRLAFEPNVLSCVGTEQRVFDVTFIGSFHRMHSRRTALLNDLCARFPSIKVWGHGIDHLPSSSPIRKSYMGEAWGRDMYHILAQSKMTLNHHGNVPSYANNFRLFESTGMGTLLITDWKENLHEMFEPGKEVVAYHSLDDCAELIDYYLRHDDEREAIARAGQERTLRDHTFRCRMQEFVDIVGRYL
jgi:hypothetical protein